MLQRRLLLSYLALLSTALTLLGGIVLITVSGVVNSEMKAVAQTAFDDGEQQLEDRFDELVSTLLDISVDPQLQETLEVLHRAELTDLYVASHKVNSEVWRLNHMLKSGEELKVYPITADNAPTYWEPDIELFVPSAVLRETEWYPYYLKGTPQVLISCQPDGDEGILFSKNIISTQDWSTVLGIACVEIKKENLNLQLNRINLGETGDVLLTYQDQVFLPVFRSEDQSLSHGMTSSPFVDKENNRMVFTAPVGQTEFILIGIVPMDEILSKSVLIRHMFVITAVITILLSLALAITFSNSLTRPILNVANAMKNIQLGNLDTKLPEEGTKGEVKVLCESFNYMTDMINHLIEDATASRLSAKQSELQALQAQINPHFLYNTLDTINWMAMRYQAQDIQSVVGSLAVMLRRSLNNGQNLITVRDELEQLSSYLSIQKFRFDDLFEHYFLIDPMILDRMIIKLILQPLVENALIHGFDDDRNDGRLFINGYQNEETIVFDIMNNGNPVDLGRIHQTLYPDVEDHATSYGIKNVNDRLIQQYGAGSALQYFIEGNYTVARICIPITNQPVREGEEWS